MAKIRLEGGLFDYDGVIANSAENQFHWFQFWAHRNGKKLPFTQLKEFMAFYNERCSSGVQAVYDSLGLPCNMSDTSHPVWSAYLAFKKDHPVELHSGIREAIAEIWHLGSLSSNAARNKRLRLAINTTQSWKSIYPRLEHYGLLPFFDSFVTKEVMDRFHGAGGSKDLEKPSKISVAYALGLIGSDGERTFHVGDTLNDLRASMDVHMPPQIRAHNLIIIGAAWGYEGREALEEGIKMGRKTFHFDHIAGSPRELPGIIRNYM